VDRFQFLVFSFQFSVFGSMPGSGIIVELEAQSAWGEIKPEAWPPTLRVDLLGRRGPRRQGLPPYSAPSLLDNFTMAVARRGIGRAIGDWRAAIEPKTENRKPENGRGPTAGG
jgi:hypothetical protein